MNKNSNDMYTICGDIYDLIANNDIMISDNPIEYIDKETYLEEFVQSLEGDMHAQTIHMVIRGVEVKITIQEA